MQYDSLKRLPSGGLASFLTSNMDEIEDNVLAFGAPRGINSMVDVGNRMASMGRNGDNQLVHMKTGEIAVSPEILKENPQLAKELTEAFDRSNVDMARYTVGSGANSVNPMTGQAEFFLKKLVSGVKKVFKKIAPIVIPIGLNMLMPGLGAVGSGALGAGIGTLVQGGSLKDAFKSAALGGLAGGVMAGFGMGGPSDATSFSERAFGKLGGYEGDFFNNPFKSATASQGAASGSPKDGNILTRTLDKGKDLYSNYLDPNRNVMDPTQMATKASKLVETTPTLQKIAQTMPEKAFNIAMETVKSNQPSFLSRYGPLALAGTAVAGAAGAFDTPEENLDASPFGTTSQELFAANPARYSVFAGFNKPTPISSAQVSSPQDSGYIYQKYLPRQAAAGGIMNRQGQRNASLQNFPRRQGFIAGPGTETSDDIPAMLSDGEFVMTARAVRGAGNGSREQGVRKMYDMMRAFEGGSVA